MLSKSTVVSPTAGRQRAGSVSPAGAAPSSVLVVNGVTPAAFELILRYLYTDVVLTDNMPAVPNLVDLLHASARFELVELNDRIERALMSSVNVGNVVEIMTCAEDTGFSNLLDSCFAFSKSQFSQIAAMPAFISWASQRPDSFQAIVNHAAPTRQNASDI